MTSDDSTPRVFKTSWVAIWIALSLVGCNDIRLSTPKPIREGSYLVHVVSPAGGNEEIDTILIWYTGSENTRDVVQEANKGRKLNQLHPGQRILIPQSIVTQTNPLPRRKFSFSRDASENLGGRPNVPTVNPGRAHKASQQVDPLEEILSQQAAKQAMPTAAPIGQEKREQTPETFDIEEEQGEQQQDVEVAASQKQGKPPVQSIQKSGAEPSDIDAMLKREQAEVDALRRQLAPQGVQPPVDPDEHLP
jgi:hypothetical protein